jgi:transposase
MKRFLTPEKRLTLMQAHRQERCKKDADRIKAVLLSDDGWTQDRIASALFIHISTVQKHLEDYTAEDRLKAIPQKGADPILTKEESQILSDHLEAHVYTKVKHIQSYIKINFQKEMGLSTIRNWLKVNKFSYKKPVLRPKGADPEKQAEFIKTYEQVMTQAALNNDPVLFGDAVHPTQQTQAVFGWIKRGKEKRIETTGARKRINLMGALNLSTMKLIRRSFETINGAATVEFLQTVEASYPDAKNIHMILDRAGYHKCVEVEEYLKTSRIRVHFLPPRSPNLNPIERLWKIMHEHVSHNKVYANFKEFKKALNQFFDLTMQNITQELVSRITDAFQLITNSEIKRRRSVNS